MPPHSEYFGSIDFSDKVNFLFGILTPQIADEIENFDVLEISDVVEIFVTRF